MNMIVHVVSLVPRAICAIIFFLVDKKIIACIMFAGEREGLGMRLHVVGNF